MLLENDKTISTDKDGYLNNLNDWSEDIALVLAMQKGIKLSDEHWHIITLIKQFYNDYDLSPAMRPLVKYIANHSGKEKGNSIYLMRLFAVENKPNETPESPAKIIARIAGLPKPANCL